MSYNVNNVCQFMSEPMEEHWKAVKRILRYLKGTIDYGLSLKSAPHGELYTLEAFCDADWGMDIVDRGSISRECIFFGPNFVSWWSKKQSSIARSTTEAQYRSLDVSASELLWIQSLLRELCIKITTPAVYCDNLSTVALSHNPVLHSRTKHMELDIFFVREKVLDKSLLVCLVPAYAQLADVLTKPLAK